MAVKVLLDSNFLLIPAQFKIDIFEELNRVLEAKVDPIILSPVYQEIKRLSNLKNERLRRRALLALKLAKRCRIVHVKTREGESVDELLVRIAEEWRCPVATNDAELRRKLREKRIATIFLRDFSHLEVEGYTP